MIIWIKYISFGFPIFDLIATRLIYVKNRYSIFHTVNDMHSTYSSFTGSHKLIKIYQGLSVEIIMRPLFSKAQFNDVMLHF